MSIPSIQNSYSTPITSLTDTEKKPASSTIDQIGQSFSSILNSLSESENNSDNLLQKLAAGEDVDVHNVMIAAEETDVSFRVALAIRDRLVEAYREISRMTV
jgi:flagellar hook-basal body complex protein FliE